MKDYEIARNFANKDTQQQLWLAGKEENKAPVLYTEQEVESLLHKFMQSQKPDWHGYSTLEWFKQNKK